MRPLRTLGGAFLALLIAILAACAPATIQKRAAQTLESIAIPVDGGMHAAAAWYKEGRLYNPENGVWTIVSPEDVLLTDQDWSELGAVHEKFRRAGKLAAIAIRATGPALGDREALLADVSAAAKEVLALIDLFRAKRKELKP